MWGPPNQRELKRKGSNLSLARFRRGEKTQRENLQERKLESQGGHAIDDKERAKKGEKKGT